MPFDLRRPEQARRLLVVAAALAALFATASLVRHWRERARARAAAAPADESTPTFDRLYLRDLDVTSYDGSHRLYRLRAGEVVHRKRKIGPLTLNPVKEVEMTGIRIEMYGAAPGAGGESGDLDLRLPEMLAGVLKSKDLGFVSRIVMRDFEVDGFDGPERRFSLAAGRAAVGTESATVHFDAGFTLRARDGSLLSAAAAEWRVADRRLVLRGEFEERDAAGSRRGRNATFRIGPDGAWTAAPASR